MRSLAVVPLAALAACPPAPLPQSAEPLAPVQLPAPVVEDASAPAAVMDAAVEAGPDWNAELEWARSRYPELKDFQLPVDLAPLLGWVTPGQATTLYLSADKHRCKPVVSSRQAADDESIGFLIFEAPKLKGGQKVRAFVNGAADTTLRIGFGGGEQRLNADGVWEDTSAWATSGASGGNALSSVEGDIAHFDAERVRLEASCGPTEQLACTDGGTRPCNRCTEVKIDFFVVHGGATSSRGIGIQPSTCSEPCPSSDNPDLTRLTAVLDHFDDGFRPLKDGRAHVGLYKTLAQCTADQKKKRK